MLPLLPTLYQYSDWANAKVIALAKDVPEEQLDAPRPMGFGTLRATLYHILAAEQIWLERWQGVPWRPFPTDPQGMAVADIAEALADVAGRRNELIEAHSAAAWSATIEYQDSKQTLFRHRLRDLLLHVVHHGVHHRAQALNYLRRYQRTLSGGIDYIFYRLAVGRQQSPEAIQTLREYGLAASADPGESVAWEREIVCRQFEYSDWASQQLLSIARNLDDEQLDRSFEMGLGSIRKLFAHLFDAERWWNDNWTQGPTKFPHSPAGISIAEIEERWRQEAATRNAFLMGLDSQAARRAIEISFGGGPPLQFEIGDTANQLTLHGTHHRAQIVNLLRQVGSPSKDIDLLYALAELSASTVPSRD